MADLAAEAILTPLPGPDSAGPDLRHDPVIDVITEARRQDDSLEQGIWSHERKSADWGKVVDLCRQVLTSRSKDLQILVWMVEAQVHRDGFAALAPGFALIGRFCRVFWDDMHPGLDEDGDAGRRANIIEWLGRRLPPLLRTLPVTSSGFAEPVRLSWGDCLMARRRQAGGGDPSEGPTLAAFEASAQSTPVNQLMRLQAEIAAGLKALEQLGDVVDDLCRPDPPSLTEAKTLLHDLLGWLASLVPTPVSAAPADNPKTASPEGEPDMPVAPQPPRPAGPITNRDDAYRHLAEVVEYLMRTEPHSPTPYVLRRVLAWGNMSLDQVLVEMSGGRNDLATVLELISSKE